MDGTDTGRRGAAGAILLSDDGTVLARTGVGADPRLTARLSEPAVRAELVRRRLMPLALGQRPLVLMQVPVPDGAVVIALDAPGEVVTEFLGSVDFAVDILDQLLSDPFTAMTVVEADGRVAYISPVHERFFGLARGEAVGRPAKEVIENTRLPEVAATGKAEIGHVQEMRGAERVVMRTPVMRGGRVIGAMGRVMFKGPEEAEALARRVSALQSEVEFLRREADAAKGIAYGLDGIIGDSPAVQRLRADIVKVAPIEIPVLIHGESGTGKELVAHAIHQLSPRRDKQMVLVNAAAIPATLVEAELFGYEPGAFTGADRKGRKGKFEKANGSTIFLDEIGDMPLEVQVKLLRVVQDRVVERIGGERPRESDFRLVCATNRDLDRLVADGDFRLDLYYRIAPIMIHVPPLRARGPDIGLLAGHFLARFRERHRLGPVTLSDDAIEHLSAQPWPGNVRQLRAEVERAAVFCEGRRITRDDFRVASTGAAPAPALEGRDLKARLDAVEADAIRSALARHRGNKKRVAEELGVSRSWLYKRLSEIGV